MLTLPQSLREANQPLDVSCGRGFHTSPLGTIGSWWTERGLVRLSWDAQTDVSEADADVSSSSSVTREIAEFDELLQAYFSGEPKGLRQVRLDSRGWTPFFTDVYKACRAIPAGETRRYADLARAVGRPRAVRAVGQAMARNRVPLVIPCHRVIGSDGRLCGFSAPGGLDAKQRLLELEKRPS